MALPDDSPALPEVVHRLRGVHLAAAFVVVIIGLGVMSVPVMAARHFEVVPCAVITSVWQRCKD